MLSAVASFAAGLLLGGCITMFGLRGFLLRRDTLLRQSSLEGLARLRPSSLASAKDAIRGSPVPPPPVPPPRPPRPPRPPSASSAPALPVPPPHLETSLTTTTHVAPTTRVREEVPSANALPAAQDPSGLRSCKKRSCLGSRTAGGDISQIHRSVILLATGGEQLPVFHGPGFFPLYIVTEDKDAQTLFEGGANSLLYGLDRFQDLPFVDFAADIVVLDVSSFSKASLGGVVTEAVRILAPQGVLFVSGAADFDISDFSPQAAKLVFAGSYAHSFVRRVGVVPDLPVCKACGMRSMFGDRKIELSPENQCQAWIQPGFKSIFQKETASKFNPKPKESVENQRLQHWWRPNVLKTQQGEDEWADVYSKKSAHVYKAGYTNSDPYKLPPHLEEAVKAGKFKRILDAGAGSCSLEGELRRKGYFKTVRNFLAFGAYDCSMLRICAERGSISFQHNWLIPLPVCASCKFDLIYQFAGIHHMRVFENYAKFLDNMLAVLECNGLLFVNDHGPWRPEFRKALKIRVRRTIATYTESNNGAFAINRIC